MLSFEISNESLGAVFGGIYILIVLYPFLTNRSIIDQGELNSRLLRVESVVRWQLVVPCANQRGQRGRDARASNPVGSAHSARHDVECKCTTATGAKRAGWETSGGYAQFSRIY